MKQISTFLMVLMISSLSFGQIFSEDFEGGMPATFTIIDNDGLTPATNVNWCTDAWVARADFEDATDQVAASISWYTAVGTSDDYMITPGISIPSTGSPSLVWDAKAQDPTYADGYEVIISTVGATLTDMQAGTVVYSTTGEDAVWTKKLVDLSSYLGQTIYIGFRNNSTDKFVLLIDDILVDDIVSDEVELVDLGIYPYHEGGSDVTIEGSITNNGSSTLTSVDVEWTDGTNTKSRTISGLNVAFGTTYDFTHTDKLTLGSGASTNNITVTLSNPNGNSDDAADNSMNSTVYGMSEVPNRTVLIEEKTGTWCGWCPRGAVGMESITKAHEDVFGVAVHNGDPMVVSDYDSNIGTYIPGGYPGGGIDRVISLDPNAADLETGYQIRKEMAAPVKVSAEHRFVSGNIEIDVNVEFLVPFNGDIRLGGIISEDDVIGTGTDWGQTNYYDGGGAGALSGAGVDDWTTAGDPVTLNFDHVGRALVGGIVGESGILPSSITAGYTQTHKFMAAIPSEVAGDSPYHNLHIGVGVYDATTGEALNFATSTNLMASVSEKTTSTSIVAYPNPTSDFIRIEGSENLDGVTITDLLGKIVYSSTMNTTSKIIDVRNFHSGVYILDARSENQTISEKIIIRK